jgi:hypothetical protein
MKKNAIIIVFCAIGMMATLKTSAVEPLSAKNQIEQAGFDRCLITCISERRDCERICNGDADCTANCWEQFESCMVNCDN